MAEVVFWIVVLLMSPIIAGAGLLIVTFALFVLIGPWVGVWIEWKHRDEWWRGGGKF